MASAVRAYLYNLLKTDTGLNAVIAGRVYQQGAVLTAQQAKPYIVFHFGHQTDEGMFDESGMQPNRQYVEIYLHTNQGDYGPLDDLVDLVKTAMTSRVGRPANLIHMQYLETSQDLQDTLLQTYFRYMRYQLIQSK